MTSYYVDSSVGLAAMLGTSARAARWLEATATRGDAILTSRLLRTEVHRVLRREALDLRRADSLRGLVQLVPLDEDVLHIAEAIESHVTTVDALHLAAALYCGLGPTVLTHDTAMAAVARQPGLRAHDPV